MGTNSRRSGCAAADTIPTRGSCAAACRRDGVRRFPAAGLGDQGPSLGWIGPALRSGLRPTRRRYAIGRSWYRHQRGAKRRTDLPPAPLPFRIFG